MRLRNLHRCRTQKRTTARMTGGASMTASRPDCCGKAAEEGGRDKGQEQQYARNDQQAAERTAATNQPRKPSSKLQATLTGHQQQKQPNNCTVELFGSSIRCRQSYRYSEVAHLTSVSGCPFKTRRCCGFCCVPEKQHALTLSPSWFWLFALAGGMSVLVETCSPFS